MGFNPDFPTIIAKNTLIRPDCICSLMFNLRLNNTRITRENVSKL